MTGESSPDGDTCKYVLSKIYACIVYPAAMYPALYVKFM